VGLSHDNLLVYISTDKEVIMSAHRQNSQTKRAQSVDERLQKYPQLQKRVEELLDLVENSNGDVVKADEAEELLFEELRRMGQDTLTAWAERKHSRLIKECDSRSDLSRKQKKDSTGTPASGESR
jgi:TolA-binding protein